MNGIVESVTPAGDLPHYEAADDELGPGASLGNGHTWVNTGTDGRIYSFFSTDVGQEVAGPLIVRYGSPRARVSGMEGTCCERADVPLTPVGTGRFIIHPAYQRHCFDLPGELEVEETVFVPLVPDGAVGDDCVAYYRVAVRNRSQASRSLSVHASARMAGSRRTPVIAGRYDEEHGALLAWEEEQADWVRVLTSTRRAIDHAITDDFSSIYDADRIIPLSDQDDARGDVLARLHVPLEIAPGESEELDFILLFSPMGRAAARERLEALRDVDAVFEATLEHLRQRLAVCQVLTPDPVINEGALWSKLNMLRVLAHYPMGEAFTNEPGVSSNVVARDVIWFIYGCDHFRPESSRALLDALIKSQYPSGKIPEYYNARTGEVADYDLNINDATPLFILGVNHHVRSTGDLDYLRDVYDSVAAAGEYILSQTDERGLVFCDAEGEEVWGIASWRNVIPNYRINGAVTEINAECSAALRALGHLAKNMGRDEDGDRWRTKAMAMADALNEHLLQRERRLYLLNIDREGRAHTDVTADELFPVLFRVADTEVAFRIIRRLNSPDFWTPAGLRTVSRDDPLYDPARYVGLLGGVWPGLTWWYAFAAARYHPDFMVRALHASFEHYQRHPRVYNTVPGQFSEWFDGESLINRGMRLSPWEPPRFLWAAVEGVCGVMVSPKEPGIRPLIPADWKWSAVVRLCYHGRHVTAFACRRGGELCVYANADFKSDGPKEVFDEDLTGRVRAGVPGVHPVALAGNGRLLLALGSCRDHALTAPVELGDVLESGATYRLRHYSSEKGEWGPQETGSGRDFAELGLRIESQGFHLLEFERD